MTANKKKTGYENYKEVYGIKDTSKYVDPTKRSDGVDRKEYTSNEVVVEHAQPTSIKALVESGHAVKPLAEAFAVDNTMTLTDALNTEDPTARNGVDLLVALSHSNKTIKLVDEFLASPKGKEFLKTCEDKKKKLLEEKKNNELKALKDKLEALKQPPKEADNGDNKK